MGAENINTNRASYPKVLLLPGMDGTGTLFKPLLDLIPNYYEVEVVSLIQEVDISYEYQAETILKQIEKDVVIVAESYSGVIALEMLKKGSPFIKHVIFMASFIAPPSLLSKFGRVVPSFVFSFTQKNNSVIHRFLFGRYGSDDLCRLFDSVMEKVDAKLLTFRLGQIATLKKQNQQLNCPCTLIQARQDNLVSYRTVNAFKAVFNNLDLSVVEGTHFLIQTNPYECWQLIEAVIKNQKI